MTSSSKIYFKEPRLEMTIGGRFLTRVVFGLGYFLFFGLTLTIFISGIINFFWIGILFLLFLIDRFFHLRNPDYTIKEIVNKNKINLAQVLSPYALRVIEKSYEKSLILKKDICFLIIKELLDNEIINLILKRLEINPNDFKSKLENLLNKENQELEKTDKTELNLKIEKIMTEAFKYCLRHNIDFIDETSLFFGIFNLREKQLDDLLNFFKVDILTLEQAILFENLRQKINFKSSIWGWRSKKITKKVVNRAWTSRPTPFLDRFSVDLTYLAFAGELGFMIGHQKEYQRLVEILSRTQNPNVLLVGETGVGKKTIINHLAQNICDDNVPKFLFDKRVIELQMSLLVSGAEANEIQERLMKIVEEIILAGNIILVIPEVHNLVKTSGMGYLSAADALLPIIQNDAFPVIGTTYPREFKQIIEPHSNFLNSFEVINVSEVSEEEAEKILIYKSLILEKEYNVFIALKAIKSAVKLAKKYFHFKPLPSSAEEILRSAISEANLREQKIINQEDILLVVEQKSEIPVSEVGGQEKEALLNLEEIIHQKFVNQDQAVSAVADALREYRTGLSKQNSPVASFLFLGPPGVGKTELAKILAEIQFGSQNKMIRIDMSLYQTKESIYKLIGSPDGQILGELTEAVLQKPYSLVLLDEFEKAHPDILNIFLTVLGEGKLIDGLGREIDFTNTIIIATSNAHSDIVLEAIKGGQPASGVALYLKEKLIDYFRPELLNRFSKIIVFNELNFDDISKIVKIHCNDLSLSLKEKGIQISFDDSALKFLTKLSYDPKEGARLVSAKFEEKIKSPLAREILAQNIQAGDKVLVEAKEDKIIFNVLK